ncbi:MAG TPA: FlgD immunoglobulin-like domain containing protein [Ignavibacteriaceae bacterium]|nr:FlgD immunoglobulin-like domain containing protein [Ignavibacteriaceae bacterium]
MRSIKLFLYVQILLFFAVNSAYAQPVLGGPANASTNNVLPVTLTWTGAGLYDIVITQGTIAGPIVYSETGTTATSLVLSYPTLNYSTRYYWTISDINGDAIKNFWTSVAPPAVPALVSPADLATGISLPPTLTWADGGGGAVQFYHVQVATDAGFASIVFEDAAIPGATTTTNATGLLSNTLYYWRVRASNVSGAQVSAFSGARSFTTSLDPPGVPTLVSPANAATGLSLTPTLSWSDGGGGTVELYHVQVATDAGFASIVFEDNAIPGVTTSAVTSSLSYGTTYYWRVKASNMGGVQNSAFSASRTFTTLLAPPAVPVLVSPANAATGLSITPTLSWSDGGGGAVELYHIQVATDAGFASIVFEDNAIPGITTSIVASGLLPATQYYWRVKSSNEGGTQNSAFSASRSFTTFVGVVLLTPTDGATGLSLPINFSWSGAGGPYWMQIQVAGGSWTTLAYDNNSLMSSSVIVGNPNLVFNTAYEWRVSSDAGLNWSMASFTSTEVPGTPTLLLPAAGDIYVLNTPFFLWTPASNSPADYFILQITPDPTFYNVHHNINVPASYLLGQDQGYQLTVPLATGSPYYWRVRGVNGAGAGPFAAPRSFQVAASGDSMPPVPIISYPRNGETAYTLSPDLNWYVTHYAVGVTYEIEFNMDGVFTGVPTVTGITNYYYPAPGAPLDNNTTYYYKVRANRGGIYSVWSDSAAFTTLPVDVPFVPIQSWPIGNVTIWSDPTQLNWYVNGNSTTLTYDVEFNTDNNFTGVPTPGYDNINANNIDIPTTGIGVTFYWRVRSFNGTTYSAWTATEQFRTAGWSGSATPITSTPVDGHTVYSNDVVLGWFIRGYSAAYEFELQFSTDGNWANPITTQTFAGIDSTSFAVTGLTFGSTYYWRVRSIAGSTQSAWSSPASFSVIGPNGSTVPNPSWPIGSASIPSDNVKLLWYLNGPIVGLVFDVEYNTSGIFTGVPTVSGLTQTELQLTGLTNGSNYFWRVRSRASNGSTTSAWSVTADFVVLSGLLSPVPRIGAPDNNITLMTVSPNISWYVMTPGNSLKYEVQYSTNQNFAGASTVSDITDMNTILSNLTSNTTYFWRVRSVNNEGNYSAYSNTGIFVPSGTTSADNINLPISFEVAQNYPNPFNPSTTINFALPTKELVIVKVYDVLGKEVKTLINEEKEAGYHSINWNGDNQFGQKVSSGNYMVRIVSGAKVKTIKMTLMK